VAVALVLALGAAPAAAEVVGGVEHFPTKCAVGRVIAGPEGAVWFNCIRENPPPRIGGQALIGKVTPSGAVTEYGLPKGVRVADLVAGPDGNLWFTYDDGDEGFGPTRGLAQSAIGRLTPSGGLTLFRAGLRQRSRPQEIVPGPEGDLWFVDGGHRPEIGRITPAGTIAEFPTGVKAPLGIGGLAAGIEGSLWFTQAYALPHGEEGGGVAGRLSPPDGSVTHFGTAAAALGAPVVGAGGDVWFSDESGSRSTLDRLTPGGELTRLSQGLSGFPTSLTAGPDGNVWFTAQHSIGRVTPEGQITQFTECLNYSQFFSEAIGIVPGAEGNLWFTSVTSRELPSMGEPPTIGRITPSGAITMFKAGIGPEPHTIVAGPDGKIWFAGGADQIARIDPPRAPVNTFIPEPGVTTARGVAYMSFEVPGPGTVKVGKVELLLPHKRTLAIPTGAGEISAPSCGAASLTLHLHGKALAYQRGERWVRLRITATFTPPAAARTRGPRRPSSATSATAATDRRPAGRGRD
jgi:streptogramin lyase